MHMTAVSQAANLSDPDHYVPADLPDHDVSPAAARALHADAVRLKRGELFFVIPSAILAVAAAGAVLLFPWQLWFLAAPAGALTLRAAQWAIEWSRLRGADPVEYVHREQREEVDLATAVAQHQERWAVTRPFATPALMIGIAVVTVIQFTGPGVERSIRLAALVKESTRAGEWWRLLTASYVHVNLWHLVGNLSGLFVLGGLVEAYDRRLRVPLAYLAGVVGGSLASLVVTRGSALGSSAGILGLAGYLLIFMHRQPGARFRWLRGRLLGMLGSTMVVGLAGFFFIDNAAHVGGLLAGILLGVGIVPAVGKTSIRSTVTLDVVSWVATAVLVGAGAFTVTRLIG
jgi:membrane associated rhomboid family serine protease